MNPALQRESLLALDDLREALERIDASAWRDELAAGVRARVEAARERFRRIADADNSPGMNAARERIHALLADLDALPAPREAALSAWTAFRARASRDMDSLGETLRELAAAKARPSNLARSFFHALSGLTAVVSIALLRERRWLIVIALAFSIFAWTSEILRRRYRGANLRLMRVLGPIAHPHEWHKVNSATWFCTGLLALSIFAPLRAAALGCAVLALGDPAAALIGRRFGRTRIINNRSVEGTLAFVAVGTLVSAAAIPFLPGGATSVLLVALTAGVVGALTELFSKGVDDNLSIPVVTAVAVALAERLAR